MARVVSVAGRHSVPLDRGWELLGTQAGAAAAPHDLPGDAGWLPAIVPGTVAAALRAAGAWSLESPAPLHDRDFWYRTRLRASGRRTLRLGGLATLAELWLDGRQLLTSDNMFLAHEVELDLAGEHALHLCFRALHPALAQRRGRARWRPRMVTPPSLRFARTTLLGHMPTWCPSVHAVGPWRPIELVEEQGPLRVRSVDLGTRLEGKEGRVSFRLALDGPPPRNGTASLRVGDSEAALTPDAAGGLACELRLPEVEPWWPHTHGSPRLYDVRASIGDVAIDLGRTGFRSIERDGGADGRGFQLRINGEPVFCRGACWSTADIVSLPGTSEAYAPWLEAMRAAGMNMVRVGGTMAYESDAFFGLCDELGILVWQDFMLANLDYPATDPAFVESLRREARQLLDRTQASPSLAVLCGGSEVAQQAAMLGLPPAAGGGPIFDELLPAVVAESRPDVPYVPSSPSGGEMPFVTNAGITHYYGVGAYLRPLEDARRAEVRFTSECLAFANLPDSRTLEATLPSAQPHDPLWKAGVPRDAGVPWDFEDVRDHYLELLYGVTPARLRYEEPDRYLRLSRAVTAEVMEATIGEWRRAASPCAGALVWLLQDLRPGAGWGVLDIKGAPKAAWHGLRRACRPIQLILTDEGLNGLALHVVNESPRQIRARLSLACLRAGSVPVVRAERELTIAAREALELSSFELLGRFFDITYAYRFGPPAHDVTVARLVDAESGAALAEAFHFPLGRALPVAELGLEAKLDQDERGWLLTLASSRLAQSVHIEDPHFRGEEEWFHLAPGAPRQVRLVPLGEPGVRPDGAVHALNGTSPARYRP